MSSTPIPPINPDPDPDADLDGRRDRDFVDDIPGTDPDLLERDADGNLLEDDVDTDEVVREPDGDLDVRAGKDPLDGAAVEFESESGDEAADPNDSSTKTVTVIDATPETLGVEVQDGPAPDTRG